MLDVSLKPRVRFSLRDKRLFEITEVEITRVEYIYVKVGEIFFLDISNSDRHGGESRDLNDRVHGIS